MVNWIKYAYYVLVIVILVMMFNAGYKVVREAVPKENHCLDKETKYYRSEGGWLFGREIETDKAKADYAKDICIKWEDEPSLGKAMLGQELIIDKEAGG